MFESTVLQVWVSASGFVVTPGQKKEYLKIKTWNLKWLLNVRYNEVLMLEFFGFDSKNDQPSGSFKSKMPDHDVHSSCFLQLDANTVSMWANLLHFFWFLFHFGQLSHFDFLLLLFVNDFTSNFLQQHIIQSFDQVSMFHVVELFTLESISEDVWLHQRDFESWAAAR